MREYELTAILIGVVIVIIIIEAIKDLVKQVNNK